MAYTDRLFDLLSGLEGYRDQPYKDVNGIATGGYGTNLTDPSNQQAFSSVLGRKDINDVIAGKSTVSKDEWKKLYDHSASNAGAWVDQAFPGAQMSDNQRLALTSLAYNNPALLGPKLIKAIKSGDLSAAENEIRNNSNRTGDKGLQNRRNMEADLFASADPSFMPIKKTVKR